MGDHTHGPQIGEVMNYFEHVGVAAITLTGALQVGDTVHIVGGDVDHEETITSMQVHNSSVESAKAGDQVGIKIGVKARKGYKIFVAA